MKPYIYSILAAIMPILCHAKTSEPIWKVTYYNAIPNKSGITKKYCKQHTIGTFIGTVSSELKNGIISSNNIALNHFTFHSITQQGIYFLNGQFDAYTDNWHDHIYYAAYKLSTNGETQGVWHSDACKGFFKGRLLSTK